MNPQYVPASGVVGQGASEDDVAVADSCDVTSRLLFARGEAATKLESEMTEKRICERCILVCSKR
jgi:hypothetical protein